MTNPIITIAQFLSLLLFAFSSLAATTPAKIDSVLQQYGNSSKAILVDTMVNRAIASIEKIDYESGMLYVKEAFEIGKEYQLDEPAHRALITYARLGILINDTDQPYEELILALRQRKEEGNGEKQYSILNAMALIHEHKKEYDQMAKILYEANELLESTATNKRPLYGERASSYLNMGHGLSHIDQVKANSYFRKSLELALLSKDEAIIYITKFNLAYSCINLKMYEEGIDYLNQSMENMDNLPMVRQMATHIGLAQAHTHTKDFLSAEFHYIKALDLISHEETGDKYMILKCLAEVYYLDHQFPKAIELAMRSIDYYKERKAFAELKSIYDILHESHAAINEYDQAYAYQQQYAAVSDSLIATERKQELLKLEAEFASHKKDQEIQLLSQKNQNKNLFLGFLGLLLVSLITVSGLYYKKWKLEQILKREREKIHRETLNAKERTLTRFAITNQKKNEYIDQIKQKIKGLAKHPTNGKDYNSLVRKLENVSNSDQDVQEFLLHFEQVHPLFFSNLQKQSKKLTRLDFKHCAFIKLELDTKQIASILNIDPKSVQMARYRIKKKLQLSKEESLRNYLISI